MISEAKVNALDGTAQFELFDPERDLRVARVDIDYVEDADRLVVSVEGLSDSELVVELTTTPAMMRWIITQDAAASSDG